MKVKTKTDPTKLIGAKKIEEYAPGVYYCYGSDIDGKQSLLAIVHEIDDEYVVDAESDVTALIPSATATTEEPQPLYNTYVSAYGKTAVHTGPAVVGDNYHGHKIICSEMSNMTWEQIRKLEYQISKPIEVPDPIPIEEDNQIIKEVINLS